MITDISTRLDAVNYIIGGIGLTAVPSLDMFNADISMANMYLDNYSRYIQMGEAGEGWWFNREGGWKLSPDPVNGRVTLPNNMLSAYSFDKYRRRTKMATRGRALYDTKAHHYDMRPFVEDDGYMHLLMVVQLDYEDLPQSAKDAICKAAAMKFAASAEMEVNRLKVLDQEASDAYFRLQAEETAQTANNAFTDSLEMAYFIARAGGQNRNGY